MQDAHECGDAVVGEPIKVDKLIAQWNEQAKSVLPRMCPQV